MKDKKIYRTIRFTEADVTSVNKATKEVTTACIRLPGKFKDEAKFMDDVREYLEIRGLVPVVCENFRATAIKYGMDVEVFIANAEAMADEANDAEEQED